MIFTMKTSVPGEGCIVAILARLLLLCKFLLLAIYVVLKLLLKSYFSRNTLRNMVYLMLLHEIFG